MDAQTAAYAIAGLSALIGSGGGAWVGLKVGLNGTRDRVTRIENKQERMNEKLDRLAESTTRLEALYTNRR